VQARHEQLLAHSHAQEPSLLRMFAAALCAFPHPYVYDVAGVMQQLRREIEAKVGGMDWGATPMRMAAAGGAWQHIRRVHGGSRPGPQSELRRGP